MAQVLDKGSATEKLVFFLADETDLLTAETGASPTVYLSLDGGTFAASTNSAVEIGRGFYYVIPTTSEKNGRSLAIDAYATGTTTWREIHQIETFADYKADVSTIGTNVTAIKTKTDNLPSDPADQSLITASIAGLNNLSITSVETALDNAFVYYDLATASAVAALNNLSQVQAQSAAAAALAAYTPATAAAVAALYNVSSEEVQDAAEAALAAYAAPTETSLAAALAGLNDPTVAEIAAAVEDLFTDSANAEPTAVPAANAALALKIAWLFALARNKRTQDSDTETLYADNGTTEIATSGISDDGTTLTKGEYV